jgi:hypothetical protein
MLPFQFGRSLKIGVKRASTFCTEAKKTGYRKPVEKNTAMALVLLSFVAGVYYISISKMRQVREM